MLYVEFQHCSSQPPLSLDSKLSIPLEIVVLWKSVVFETLTAGDNKLYIVISNTVNFTVNTIKWNIFCITPLLFTIFQFLMTNQEVFFGRLSTTLQIVIHFWAFGWIISYQFLRFCSFSSFFSQFSSHFLFFFLDIFAKRFFKIKVRLMRSTTFA